MDYFLKNPGWKQKKTYIKKKKSLRISFSGRGSEWQDLQLSTVNINRFLIFDLKIFFFFRGDWGHTAQVIINTEILAKIAKYCYFLGCKCKEW